MQVRIGQGKPGKSWSFNFPNPGLKNPANLNLSWKICVSEIISLIRHGVANSLCSIKF